MIWYPYVAPKLPLGHVHIEFVLRKNRTHLGDFCALNSGLYYTKLKQLIPVHKKLQGLI